MKKRPPLNKKIIEFILEKNSEQGKSVWFKKVGFYSVFEDWSPETIGRTLRDMTEDKKLEVSYYNGLYAKGLAKYKLYEKE